MSSIAVSVIVAVQNHESTLARCLDSLVHQTLEEAFEILLVDDSSADGSMAVAEEWRCRFPQLIRTVAAEAAGKAQAMNTGIRAAKGRYVTFVDPDDYIDYRTLKRLYGTAEENGFPELAHAPVVRVSGREEELVAVTDVHAGAAEHLRLTVQYLHGKLLRKDLFERFGGLPDLAMGAEEAWLVPALSRVEGICCFPLPCYYDVVKPVGTAFPAVPEDLFSAADMICDLTEPTCREEALVYSAAMLLAFADRCPLHKAEVYRWLRGHLCALEGIGDLRERNSAVADAVAEMLCHDEEIPATVYLNGFCGQQPPVAMAQRVLPEPSIMVLSEENCDLTACPPVVAQAHAAGDAAFVGKYFALLACYEQGGIFLDSGMVVEQPFGMLLNDPAFFGYADDASFTDRVFGACAGNPVVAQVLRTYGQPGLYPTPFAPLSQRLATVLVGMCNAELRSCAVRQVEQGVCLYPVETFVCALPQAASVQLTRYEGISAEEGMPAAALRALYTHYARLESEKQSAPLRRERDALSEKTARLQKDREWLQKKADSLTESKNWLQGRVDSLTESKNWLQGRVDSLTESKNWLQGRVDSLTESKNWLQGRVDSLTESKNWLQGRVDSLTESKNWLQGKVENLTKDRTWLQGKVENLTKDRTWLQGKVENLTAERDESRERAGALQSELDAYKGSFLVRCAWKCHGLAGEVKRIFKKG